MEIALLEPWPANHQRCSVCGRVLPVEDFHWSIRSRGIRKRWCSECDRAKMAVQRSQRNANGKEAAYYSRRRRSNIDNWCRVRYGITLAEYEVLELAQGGLCAICGKPERARPAPMRRKGGIPVERKRLAVDHDHMTGAIRGLLCTGCNQALGCMLDDPALLRAAADYLERFGNSQNRGNTKAGP
jgi:Recombination endonuclease VII